MLKQLSKVYKLILFTLTAIGSLLLIFLFPGSVSASDGYSENIYVFSMTSAGIDSNNSDMILVESNGHFGLIDASNCSLSELNGQYLSQAYGLSNTVDNGISNAIFMIDYLGVDHLDFIIGTHSHSDHIGGIPEIANLNYNGIKLVDETTVYIYKDYSFINSREDEQWLSGCFFEAAISSMSQNGAILFNINSGISMEMADVINSLDSFYNVVFYGGSASDPYDDYISFGFGDFSIQLYNIYRAFPCTNENDNSIVTLLTKGSQRILLLSDINNENNIGARLSQVISNNIGGARIDLLKDAHHGTPYGSNTKVEAQNYRPVLDISSKNWGSSIPYYNFANFKHYCEKYYGTIFYAAGDADRAVVASISDNSIYIYNLTSSGSLIGMPVNNRNGADGWQIWDEGRGYRWDAENVGVKKWYYYKNGEPLTGWQKIKNKWYLFENDGEMRTGWLKSAGKWYYLTENGLATGWLKSEGEWYYLDNEGVMKTGWLKRGNTWYYLKNTGAMAIGWQKVNGTWYYFNYSGAMATGWQYAENEWYYMSESGAMLTGWLNTGGKWYYLNNTGAMVVGWQKVNGSWYFFDSSGAMKTGWLYDDSEWYYLSTSGEMLTGWRYINGYYYYFYSSGIMASDEFVSGYWLNDNGTWTYEYKATWRKNSTGWWYGDASGWYAKNSTYLIDGVYYSFDSNGYLR